MAAKQRIKSWPLCMNFSPLKYNYKFKCQEINYHLTRKSLRIVAEDVPKIGTTRRVKFIFLIYIFYFIKNF